MAMDENDTPSDEVDWVPENELDAAQIREIARNGVESLQQTAARMQEESAAMGRWILASLLTMNTAGAAGVLSTADKLPEPVGSSIVAFAIGAALAIATGVNGMITGVRTGPKLGASIEQLRLSIHESTIRASTQREVKSIVPIVRQQLIASSVLAASSLTAFFAGVFLAL